MSSYPPPPPSGPGGPPPPPGSGWGGQQPPPPPNWGGGPPPPPPPGYGGGSGSGYGGGPGGPGGYGPGGPGGPGGYGPQYGQPGFGGQAPPPPPKSRGAMPWLLGCLGCGGLFVIGGIIAALVIPQFAKHRQDAAVGDTANTALYTSSEGQLIPELREHYVPFSFRYPSDWQVVERGDSAGSSNFVKVEKSDSGFTAENFAVGYMYTTPGQEHNEALLNQILGQFQQQFAQNFPNFQRVGDDRATIAGQEATGFKFTARVHTQDGRDVDVYGRVLVLPLTHGRGLSFVMLGTPIGSEIRGVDDLGVKGGLPVILRSFRVGDVPDASSTSATPGDAAPGAADQQGGATTTEASQHGTEEPQIKEIKPLNKDSAY